MRIKFFIEGWWNYFLDKISDIRYKKDFDARMTICEECPNNRNGICAICHCVLVAKTKSEGSECPEGKWGPVGKTKKEDNIDES